MSINTTRVSAGEALDVLRAGWRAQASGAMKVSYMLHGRPGVGKTQIITQLAAEIGALPVHRYRMRPPRRSWMTDPRVSAEPPT